MISLEQNLEHEILHAIFKIKQAVLVIFMYVSWLSYNRKWVEISRLTLSQRGMPFARAVSASIKFSVSSCKRAAYLNRTRASSRGASCVLLCNAASRHDNDVAISSWYSSTWFGHRVMATSCEALRAFSRHSSATAIIKGAVFTGRGLGVTAGDFLVMLGDLMDNEGELVTEECGLRLIRASGTC